MVKEKHQYEKTQKRMGFDGFKRHQPELVERFDKPSKTELVKRLKEIAKKRAR